jgi:hypothetical protein
MHTQFLWRNFLESSHLGVLSRIWEADIRMDVMEVECKELRLELI